MLRKQVALCRIATAAIFACSLALCPPVVRAQRYVYNHSAFGTATTPVSAILADFNGDGRVDLAVANSNSNSVSILQGKPDGTFAPKSDYPTGSFPTALLASDFNGDHKQDLAVLDNQGNTVSVLLGNGDGTFQSKLDYSTGGNPIAIVAADFNADKKIDLAVANENDSTVSILLGNGDGSFRGQTAIPVDTTPTSLAGGDFNGDHKLDLITSNIANGTVTVLLSNGTGSFTRVDSPSGVLTSPLTSNLAIGDYNRDGKVDVIVSSPLTQQLFVLLGKGNGTFLPPSNIPNASGVWPGALLVRDFNRDGKLDLAVGPAQGSGAISLLLGNGDGTFQKPLASPTAWITNSLLAADLNGDGALDILMTNSELNCVDVLLGNGKGTFGSMKSVAVAPPSSGPDWAVVADFNGDGKPDIAVAEINFPNGQVSVELGNGNGTFQKPIVSPLSTSAVNANFMATGDFNGDGKLDLLVLDSYRTSFEILMGNGNGTFQAPVVTTLAVAQVALGDFDGDGKTDLAISQSGIMNSPVQIYLSNGDGTFKPGAQYNVAGTIFVADVNKDGRDDLVVYGFGTSLYVLLGNGNGTFKAPIVGPSGIFSSQMVAADFNRDGKLDLVVGTYFGIAFMAGNGNGSFQQPLYSNPTASFTGSLVAADVGGRGNVGLVSRPPNNTSLGGAVVMVGNGNGSFQPPIDLGLGGVFANPLVSGDFNSDGVSDFAVPAIGGPNGTTTSLYLSTPTVSWWPTTLNFGKVAVGTTSSPLTSTLTNSGNAPLSVASITATANYHVTQGCVGKIAVGSTCALVITFTPTLTGSRSGTVTIKDNGILSSQVIHLTGVGN